MLQAKQTGPELLSSEVQEEAAEQKSVSNLSYNFNIFFGNCKIIDE